MVKQICLIAIFVTIVCGEWHKEFKSNEIASLNTSNLFESWSKDFKKEYKHDTEKSNRYQIFKHNLNKIGKHNSDETQSYKMKLNQFADLTVDEFGAYVNNGGYKSNDKNRLRRRFLNNDNEESNRKLLISPTPPPSIDWVAKGYVTPVKNQGNCGSCWSFSATGATECNSAIATGKLISLSEQNLIDCTSSYGNLGCNGGSMEAAFQYIHNNGGLCNGTSYPYQAINGVCKSSTCGTKYNYISSYTRVTSYSQSSLTAAVAKGCVSVGIEADQGSFQFYSSGILTATCGININHGVLVVGYGISGTTEYWKIKNSWGSSWGSQGYISICKNCNANGSYGQCGIYIDPSYPNH